MSEIMTLTASDGHVLKAYRAAPAGVSKGGLVVVQEIFGVNRHMRKVADGFARDGYTVIAPAVFDRAKKDVELGYGPDDIARGRELRGKVGDDNALRDIEAAAKALRSAGKVGIVGYCWGGKLAWLAACRLKLDGAVGYYGGQIIDHVGEKPKCPTVLHFGEKDTGIPLADVEKIRARHAGVTIHVYAGAEHGFNCDERASFNAESARVARERTLAFLAKHLG
jgi:carboxymethylenebutenolidase